MEFFVFIALCGICGAIVCCVDILKRITKEMHDIEERTAEKLLYITFLDGENNRMIREVFAYENAEK